MAFVGVMRGQGQRCIAPVSLVYARARQSRVVETEQYISNLVDSPGFVKCPCGNIYSALFPADLALVSVWLTRGLLPPVRARLELDLR